MKRFKFLLIAISYLIVFSILGCIETLDIMVEAGGTIEIEPDEPYDDDWEIRRKPRRTRPNPYRNVWKVTNVEIYRRDRERPDRDDWDWDDRDRDDWDDFWEDEDWRKKDRPGDLDKQEFPNPRIRMRIYEDENRVEFIERGQRTILSGEYRMSGSNVQFKPSVINPPQWFKDAVGERFFRQRPPDVWDLSFTQQSGEPVLKVGHRNVWIVVYFERLWGAWDYKLQIINNTNRRVSLRYSVYVDGGHEGTYQDILPYGGEAVLEDYFKLNDEVQRVEIRIQARWGYNYRWSDTVVFEHRRSDHPNNRQKFEKVYIR